ncbi:MAG TPA: metallophosphoesterase, partial [Treponemataceae bacterium]|nr:metallophosphoesterase [Treponemataceae bacterium]
MKRLHTFRTTLVLILAAAVFFAVSCAGIPAPKRDAGKTYSLTVLHTNDHHGTIMPNGGEAGLAERATYVKGMRAKTENVLLLDAGDINTGTALSNMFKGEIDIKAYNMMKYDAVAFGNHEFDNDLALIEKQIALADFPFLSANITRKNGKYLDQAYIIKDFDGFRVGVFGLTTKRTLVIASPDKSLTFADEIETA